MRMRMLCVEGGRVGLKDDYRLDPRSHCTPDNEYLMCLNTGNDVVMCRTLDFDNVDSRL